MSNFEELQSIEDIRFFHTLYSVKIETLLVFAYTLSNEAINFHNKNVKLFRVTKLRRHLFYHTLRKIIYLYTLLRSKVYIVFAYTPSNIAINFLYKKCQKLWLNSLHAIRLIKNIVVNGVITLDDIICKTCHYSWPGWGNNWVVLTK